MKKITLSLVLLAGLLTMNVNAQRYQTEIFTEDQIDIAKGLPYATNLQWLLIATDSIPAHIGQVMGEMAYLKSNNAPYPARYYTPRGNPVGDSTWIKLTTLRFDAYMPKVLADPGVKRPIVIYLHTGNYLPAGINGSPCGDKSDSVVVDICKRLARRGFVALAIDYRLGWNPIAPSVLERRIGLLNAVYRSIQDLKACIRMVKGPGLSAYNLDTSKIALLGEGTGGYLSYTYPTLDKYSEFMAPSSKFYNIIDTTKFGSLDGARGMFNIYKPNNLGTKIQVAGSLGGALADTNWLEGGEPTIIGMQCVRDAFAPFGSGIVNVPPPLNLEVVFVDGANNAIRRAQDLGNQTSITGITGGDPFTAKARSLYNRTVDYILAPPEDKIFIRNGEGMYPFLLPKAAGQYDNQASPWQWWDPNSKEAKFPVPGGGGVTAHQAASASNPDMSKTKSRLYQDTIFGYMVYRFGVAMKLISLNGINTQKVTGLTMYPNPASDKLYIEYKGMVNSINISDISGRQVYTAVGNSSGLNTIPLNLTQGLYIVNISTDQGNAIEKLMIK